MAGLKNQVEEFVPEQVDSWEQYIERLSFYFEANGIKTAEMKRAVLLAHCGRTAYAVIRSLVMPQKPAEVAYADLVEKVKQHYSPAPSEIVQRFKFHKREQKQGESVSDYVADLRRLSEHCNFDTTLDSMLRDRLVCGLLDQSLQRRLLAEHELSFQKALEMAVASEMAQKNSTTIRQGQIAAADVHKVFKHKNSHPQVKQKACFRCGDRHSPETCRFRDKTCRECGKMGHIQRACLSRQKKQQPPQNANKKKYESTHALTGDTKKAELHKDNDATMYNLNRIHSLSDNSPYEIDILINGIEVRMEIDSGCACTVISESVYKKNWSEETLPLSHSNITLRTWEQHNVTTIGSAHVQVRFKDRQATLSLLVAKGKGTSLLGRNWFDALNLGISGLHHVTGLDPRVESLITRHPKVFSGDLGCSVGPPVKLNLKPDANPRFFKARHIPFAIRPKVEKEIDQMVEQGILEPVSFSEWATPIVPVVKRDGSIRICGDYRATVNPAIQLESYPLPTTSELFTKLAGCTKFIKLDLKQAYQQLAVDEKSAEVLAINTTKGLFKMKRLPFGVSSASSLFQRHMDTITTGLDGVGAYQDDVIIGGKSDEEVLRRADETLTRIENDGLNVKIEKCEWLVDEVEYLGFRIDATGIHPTREKVEAIHRAPLPTNKTELRAFLGLLNFYDRFVKGKSTKLEALHRLLDQKAEWKWEEVHTKAFEEAKTLIQSDSILVHYDPDKPLIVICDASAYGLGAVLAHVIAGREHPIAFASRTLATAERNYAQVQREALAVIFGVQKFNQYLFGREFVIITDHKPLLGLFNPRKPTPEIMSPQMLRWSLMLQAYTYEIKYRQGKDMGPADALSRLPLQTEDFQVPAMGELNMMEVNGELPLSFKDMSMLTKKDPVLSRIVHWLLCGWPKGNFEEKFKPYVNRQMELSTQMNCLFWGSRLVIPAQARPEILKMLHSCHPGVVRMKALARTYVWWPKLDADIEECVKICDECQTNQASPSKAPVQHWEWPEKPWSRLHIDFAGPYQGKTFLLVVDAHSKWLEVKLVSSMTSSAVIRELRSMFSTHGLPDTVVSDNGASFTSSEFQTFLHHNGIKQVLSAPYHPASNGQAERMVRSVKTALKKIISGDWNTRLSRYLLSQHVTPHSFTGIAPAELLLRRRPKTLLDRLHPDINATLRHKQVADQPSKRKMRSFEIEQPVYVKNFGTGKPWIPGVIIEVRGPVSYRVKLNDEQEVHRHIDQIRERVDVESSRDNSSRISLPIPGSVPSPGQFEEQDHREALRRSDRTRRAPSYLTDYGQ